MKKINLTTILLLLLIPVLNLNAQEVNWCGQADAQQKLHEEHPELMQEREELENFTQEFLKTYDRNSKTTYVIPVVVHVLHSYGLENISNEAIYAMIDQLNEDYSGTNDDIDDVVPEFQDIIGFGDMEFRLAKLDPEGNCTEGITRHYAPNVYSISSGSTLPHNTVPNWDPTSYLNIWTVHDIEGTVLAWSYVPPVSSYLDGLVTEYNHVGTSGSNKHTITHEIGHWLQLYHFCWC